MQFGNSLIEIRVLFDREMRLWVSLQLERKFYIFMVCS